MQTLVESTVFTAKSGSENKGMLPYCASTFKARLVADVFRVSDLIQRW